MQNQKHQQAKNYNKSAKDLPSLETGNAIHIQPVPNVRKWVPGTIIERINDRSYKVKRRCICEKSQVHQSQVHRPKTESQDCHTTSKGHTEG